MHLHLNIEHSIIADQYQEILMEQLTKHKISVIGTVDDLLLRPIIANIGKASYYLATFLVSKAVYTVNNDLEFINYMKTISIPSDLKLISFDVKSLYMNVLFDFTIDLILKRIYEDNEIQKNIRKKEMKELLPLQAKNVHFSYKGIVYQQCNRVATGSLLGTMLTGTFIVHLKRTLIPTLTEHMNTWKRYVDDTVSIIKVTSITHMYLQS